MGHFDFILSRASILYCGGFCRSVSGGLREQFFTIPASRRSRGGRPHSDSIDGACDNARRSRGWCFLSTDVGQGKRAVTVSGSEIALLITSMENELSRWGEYRGKAPFQRTVSMGVADQSNRNVYVVEILRTPEMDQPAFRLTIGYKDTSANLVLDKDNATNWLRVLRATSGL